MITKIEIEAITSVEVFITYRHEMGWGGSWEGGLGGKGHMYNCG